MCCIIIKCIKWLAREKVWGCLPTILLRMIVIAISCISAILSATLTLIFLQRYLPSTMSMDQTMLLKGLIIYLPLGNSDECGKLQPEDPSILKNDTQTIGTCNYEALFKNSIENWTNSYTSEEQTYWKGTVMGIPWDGIEDTIFVASILAFTFSILLLLGALCKKSCLLLPWILMTAFGLFTSVVFTVVLSSVLFVKTQKDFLRGEVKWILFLIGIHILVITVLGLMISFVRNYNRRLKKDFSRYQGVPTNQRVDDTSSEA